MATAAASKGKKLVAICPDQCSLREEVIGGPATALIIAMRENGAGQPTVKVRLEEHLGRKVPGSSLYRHIGHLKEVTETVGGPLMPDKKLADLDILDLVIQRGAANSNNWKPTIKDTIEAMKLKMQMTGNSAFDDLLAMLDGPDAIEAMGENQDSLLAPDERPIEVEEDLPEPLL